jgi:microcystin-dependent protein
MSPPFARRSYAGGAPITTIPAPVAASDTSFTVLDGANYPTGTFFCVIDIGNASEEKVFVGNRSGNIFSAVLRGEDGTVQIAHAAGAVIRHIGAATDFNEANIVASMLTTKGDVLVKGTGPGPTRLPVGADGAALVADSTAGLGLSWQAPVPTGTVLSGCWAAAPSGYLLLDGATVTGGQTLYPALWAVIPTAWRSGTNILLPDARGRVLAGAGTGAGLTDRPLGSTFGEESHVLTVAELATHGHTGTTGLQSANHVHAGTTGGVSANHTHAMAGYTAQTFVQMATSGSSGVYAAANPWTPADGIQTGGISQNHVHGFTTVGASADHAHAIPTDGSGAAHNNMPPALALNMIIKT